MIEREIEELKRENVFLENRIIDVIETKSQTERRLRQSNEYTETLKEYTEHLKRKIQLIVDTQRRDRAEIMKELVNIRKNLTIITSQAENQSLPKCPICDLPYENPARKMVCFNVCGHCLCQS